MAQPQRQMFAAGAALAFAAPAAALVRPAADAELIALCAEAQAIDVRSNAIWDAVEHLPGEDPRCEAAYEKASRELPRFHDLIAQAAELPAQTPEGWRAKALLVLANTRGGGSDSDIALSLARDLAKGA